MTSPTLPPGCAVCGKKEDIRRCSLGAEPFSIAVKRCRNAMEIEEEKLRNNPGDDPFTNGVGHFWKIHETRDYMSARMSLIDAIFQIETVESVQGQIDHLRDMLRLCRSDNIGVREMVPALMLRIGKDQECYDFVKWWATIGEQSHYDWGDMSLPYMDIKNADTFEGCDKFCHGNPLELSYTVSLILLKIKLLLDLTALDNSTLAVGAKVPRENLNLIRPNVPNSPLIRENPEIMNRDTHASEINKLAAQVNALYAEINKKNRHFWPGMDDLDDYLYVCKYSWILFAWKCRTDAVGLEINLPRLDRNARCARIHQSEACSFEIVGSSHQQPLKPDVLNPL